MNPACPVLFSGKEEIQAKILLDNNGPNALIHSVIEYRTRMVGYTVRGEGH